MGTWGYDCTLGTGSVWLVDYSLVQDMQKTSGRYVEAALFISYIDHILTILKPQGRNPPHLQTRFSSE